MYFSGAPRLKKLVPGAILGKTLPPACTVLSSWGLGVAYGSAPEKVLELLRGVAASHPGMLVEPAPWPSSWPSATLR